jgi:hypothetical protein
MPAWPRVVWSTTVTNAAPAGTTETIVGTLSSSVFGDHFGQPIMLLAIAQLTPGTGQTSIQPHLRRGGAITSTIVDAAPALTVIAASPISVVCFAVDVPASDLAAQSYVFTVTQAGGAGNAAVAAVFFQALLLTG